MNNGLFSSLFRHVARAALAYARRRRFNRLVLFSSIALFLVFLVGVAILASRTENFWSSFALNLLTELIGAFVVTVVVGGLLLGVYQEIERNERGQNLTDDKILDWLREFDWADFKGAGKEDGQPINQPAIEEINRKLDYLVKEFDAFRESALEDKSKH
jgi:hypothetical protein